MTSEQYYICLVTRRGERVRHWHWPRASAATCTNAYPKRATRVRVQRTETTYRPGEPQ